MSDIRFHFDDGTTVDIDGPERAQFAIMSERFAQGILGVTAGFKTLSSLHEKLGPFLNPQARLARIPVGTLEWEAALARNISTMGLRNGPEPFIWEGKEIEMVPLVANTVLALGSDPFRLAIKIHLNCESHAYFMGFHRKWIADLIEEGVEEGLYRPGMGWPKLVAKLREARSGPVVLSFSGGEGFPNPYVAAWMPPWPEGVKRHWDALTEQQQRERQRRTEEWDDVPSERQWALGVKGLKANTPNKPIDPTTLRSYRYRHGISLLDLLDQNMERVTTGMASLKPRTDAGE